MQNKTFYNEILTEHNRNPYHKHPLKVVGSILRSSRSLCVPKILSVIFAIDSNSCRGLSAAPY